MRENKIASRGLIHEIIDVHNKRPHKIVFQLTWVDTCDSSHKRVKQHDESVLIEGILVLADD